MKRFLSILIALAMLVSLFSLTALAFAEEPSGGSTEPESKREVTFNSDKFKQLVIDKDEGLDFWMEMAEKFSFENEWWKDAKQVNEIFEGIHYRMQPEQDIEGKESFTFTVNYGNPTEGDPYTDQTEPKPKQYKETEQVTLPAKLDAKTKTVSVEGEEDKEEPVAYFAGWEITATDPASGDLPANLKDGAFAAGAKIAMPAQNITATAIWKETQEEADKEVVPDDVLYVIYVTPGGSYTEDMKNWTSHSLTSTISLTTQGAWYFRFVVVDGTKASESGYSFDYDDVIATTYDNVLDLIEKGEATDAQLEEANCTLVYNVKDTTAPEIELSTTQKNKMSDGLTVGVSYSVSTSLTIDDCSATSSDVTYRVYKQMGTETENADKDGWVLIFDSASKKVTEGYEDSISTSGTITPLADDVSDNNAYKIVYTIKDGVSGKYGVKADDNTDPNGFSDETGYHPVMLLKVSAAAQSTSTKAMEVWKIVLYVIAGLSAVGIIVLLCIKPKQQTASARYNANANGNAETPAQDQTAEQNETTADGDTDSNTDGNTDSEQ